MEAVGLLDGGARVFAVGVGADAAPGRGVGPGGAQREGLAVGSELALAAGAAAGGVPLEGLREVALDGGARGGPGLVALVGVGGECAVGASLCLEPVEGVVGVGKGAAAGRRVLAEVAEAVVAPGLCGGVVVVGSEAGEVAVDVVADGPGVGAAIRELGDAPEGVVALLEDEGVSGGDVREPAFVVVFVGEAVLVGEEVALGESPAGIVAEVGDEAALALLGKAAPVVVVAHELVAVDAGGAAAQGADAIVALDAGEGVAGARGDGLGDSEAAVVAGGVGALELGAAGGGAREPAAEGVVGAGGGLEDVALVVSELLPGGEVEAVEAGGVLEAGVVSTDVATRGLVGGARHRAQRDASAVHRPASWSCRSQGERGEGSGPEQHRGNANAHGFTGRESGARRSKVQRGSSPSLRSSRGAGCHESRKRPYANVRDSAGTSPQAISQLVGDLPVRGSESLSH